MRWLFKLHTAGEAPFQIPPDAEPIGWDGATFVIKRDDKWHGAFFDYTAQLTFICGAAAYINAAYDKYGVDAQVSIQIFWACVDGGTMELVYTGRIAMDTVVREYKTGGVTARIENTAEQMTLINRRDVKVDLLSEQTFSGGTISPYLPFARINNTNGLPVLARVIGQFDANSNPDIIPGGPSPIIGLMYSTVPSGAGNINSCADPQHYLTWYYAFQWETDLDETQGAWLNPNFNQNNYDASECDNIGLDAPARTPATAIRANKTATYHIEYCFCVDYLLFVEADLVLASSTELNDFDFWEIGVYGQKNNDPIFQMTSVTNIPRTGYIPGGPGPGIDGCGGFHLDSLIDNRGYAQGTACFTIDELVDLTIGDEFRFFVLFRCCGEWERRALSDECVLSAINACFHDVCCLSITETSYVTYPNSYITGYLANEAFGKIVQNITDNVVLCRSDFFARNDSRPFNTAAPQCDANTFLTNGFQIRGFPTGKYTLPVVDTPCYTENEFFDRGWFLSLNELFDNLNAIFNLGAGFIETLTGFRFIVEAKEYFYQDTVVLDLGAIDPFNSELTVSYDTRHVFNRIDGGYNNWAAQTMNGLSEINAKRSWKTRLSSIKGELSIASDFIASGYTFEVTRRENFVDTGNQDTDFDDNTFVVFCESEVLETPANYLAVPQIGVNAPFTGVLQPTATLNFHLSPSANLRRWINFAAIGLEPQNTGTAFIFEAGEANYQAVATDVVNCDILATRAESGPVEFGSGRQDPFISPRVVKFEFPITFVYYNQIRQNPYGLIKFIANGEVFEGWVLSLQFKPDDISEFELILKRQ